jgi:hypothetical protein
MDNVSSQMSSISVLSRFLSLLLDSRRIMTRSFNRIGSTVYSSIIWLCFTRRVVISIPNTVVHVKIRLFHIPGYSKDALILNRSLKWFFTKRILSSIEIFANSGIYLTYSRKTGRRKEISLRNWCRDVCWTAGNDGICAFFVVTQVFSYVWKTLARTTWSDEDRHWTALCIIRNRVGGCIYKIEYLYVIEEKSFCYYRIKKEVSAEYENSEPYILNNSQLIVLFDTWRMLSLMRVSVVCINICNIVGVCKTYPFEALLFGYFSMFQTIDFYKFISCLSFFIRKNQWFLHSNTKTFG